MTEFGNRASIESLFDLDDLCHIITENRFKRVAFQFPDEHLDKCAQIYQYMNENLQPNDSIELFIIGDSTFGSSIDDISAQHVDTDLLVYFGSDLTSSGTMPVIIAPIKKPLDIDSVTSQLAAAYRENVQNDSEPHIAIITYDPCFAHHMATIQEHLQSELQNVSIKLAHLPACANLKNWNAADSKAFFDSNSGTAKLGGLLVPRDAQSSAYTTVFYVGARHEQLTSISLHMSQQMVLSYNPVEGRVQAFKGCELKEYRERIGGYLRVKDANIIGIIIGSMGLSADVTQSLVTRLEALISAARKSSYVFVMGRLNEAKLCNFPEVDVFCLISNEEVGLIKPKTFHVPVVTPWELEVGLRAREWDGVFRTDSAAVLDGLSVEDAVARIVESLPENPIDSDDDDDSEGNQNRSAQTTAGHSSATALVTVNNERQLTTFQSAAVEHFTSREFQGLSPTVPEGHDTTILPGQFGIAAGYVRYEKKADA